MFRNLASSFLSTILLSNCAASIPLSTAAPPSDYQRLTAAHVGRLPSPQSYKNALISDLEKSKGPQPGDWYACLKLSDQSFYAIFFRGDDVVEFRQPVIIDRCTVPSRPLPDISKRAAKGQAPRTN